MKIVKPDYTNCGVNVTSSVLHHFGLSSTQPTHPYVDELLKKSYKNIVLMLFDGMGTAILERFLPETSFLRSNIGTVMTAVYPSTTTNATTSIECCMAPVEHAWLGWTLYFDEIQKPVDIFINKSNGEEAADFWITDRFIPCESLFSKFEKCPTAKACAISPFGGEYEIETLDDVFSVTKSLCDDNETRFIYTYWADPDHEMHGLGCHNKRIGEILKEINDKVEAFARSLGEDTLLMLTADHGLIDAKHHYLDDHPHISSILKHPPTIEARAASFHVKEEFVADFPKIFRKEYGPDFLLLTRNEFISEYLGTGNEHHKVRDFVGDYMALSTDHDCIDGYKRGSGLVGAHAGLTEDEMLVPLIVAKK